LNGHEIKRLLSAIPDTPAGLRDRAIVLTLILTGRRRSEVLNLNPGDIEQASGLVYSYKGKGGKRGKREPPRPAFEAIQRALAAWGKALDHMSPDESIWPSPSGSPNGISGGASYTCLRRYLKIAGLPPTGVHVLRHTAAKLRRDAL
jgi:integrase